MIVYIAIGNSDDKLTQAAWANYIDTTRETIYRYDEVIHGQWYSASDSAYQNACFCVEFTDFNAVSCKRELTEIRKVFNQDSIAWAEVPETEFI